MFRLSALFLLLAVSLPAGGWPKPSAPFFHASDERQAQARADAWRKAGFIVQPVAFTGSMRPWLRGGELAVVEAYTGQTLAKGAVLIFWRSKDSPSVIHLAADVNDRAVYMTGLNCRYSDGWISLAHVRGICREVIDWPAPAPRK